MNAHVTRNERGASLLVSMIMLIVLTLMVVFAIRSGNTNLRIAGNAQSQAEAGLATQEAIEQVIEQVDAVDDPSIIKAQSLSVSTGAVTYTVAVSPMTNCLVEVPVLNDSLDPANKNDIACFGTADEDKAIKADGSLTTKPSECKTQQWEVAAGVTDGPSGAKVSQVQGISIRVPSVVTCK
jgi:hypothetical protein